MGDETLPETAGAVAWAQAASPTVIAQVQAQWVSLCFEAVSMVVSLGFVRMENPGL